MEELQNIKTIYKKSEIGMKGGSIIQLFF